MRAATATTGMRSSTGHGQKRRPGGAGQVRRPPVQLAVGFDRQPQGAVNQEQQDKQDAPGQAVGVEQGEEVSLKDALGVDGDALEKVGKGDPEQQGRQEAPQEQARVPQAPPAGVVHFAPKDHGDAP
jgi:hypothetical protein